MTRRTRTNGKIDGDGNEPEDWRLKVRTEVGREADGVSGIKRKIKNECDESYGRRRNWEKVTAVAGARGGGEGP